MNRTAFWLGIAAVIFVVSNLGNTALADTTHIKAKKVKAAPTVDGKTDKIWKKAKRVKINIPGEYTVNAKAVYTDKEIFFLFQWPDKTDSKNRVYTFKNGKWKKKRGNEDRFNVLWPINDSIKGFKEKGCQVACHKTKGEDEGSMYTNSPSERGDLWHWKSQRTNPEGYADDQYVINEIDPDHHDKTGRRADKKSGGSYSSNWNKAKSQPIYTFAKGGKGGAVLIQAKAKKFGGGKIKPGMMLPREVLARPKGSRGDIAARGVWKKGKWTLEIGRKLNTGQEDDVQFTDNSKAYLFGISVHDNAGGDNHVTSKVIELKFK